MTNFSEKVVQYIKRHILYSTFLFFRKSRLLLDNETKFCRVGQSTDHNMAHASCMGDA